MRKRAQTEEGRYKLQSVNQAMITSQTVIVICRVGQEIVEDKGQSTSLTITGIETQRDAQSDVRGSIRLCI